MVRKKRILLSGILLLMGVLQVKADKLDEAFVRKWTNHLLPLPHEIHFKGKKALSPGEIGVKISPQAGAITQNAATGFKSFFKTKTGIEPNGTKFTIISGLTDKNGKVCGITVKNASRLNNLPNKDQGYLIESVGEDKLIVTALNEMGIYYGMQTLRQLLSLQINEKSVTVPEITILDWPDFAIRGLWNSATYMMYKSLSGVKLNYAKNYSSCSFLKLNKQGEPVLKLRPFDINLVKEAKLYAFNNVPIIPHLNFLSRAEPNLYKKYPDMAGKGETAWQKRNPSPRFHCPCASSPDLKAILTGWLQEFAKQGIRDVSIWTTEWFSYCSCPRCNQGFASGIEAQMTLEVRAMVEAWKNVKKDFPDFQLRILGFPVPIKEYAKVMARVMKEVPKEVVIEEVYPKFQLKNGIYTDPLDKYAAEGYKIVSFHAGDCGPVGKNLNYIKGIKASTESMLKRKWYGAVSWMSFTSNPKTSDKINWEFASHSFCALAEWSWNAEGRTVPEYLEAWATLAGYKNPEKVAEWGQAIIPLECKIECFRRHSSYSANWLKQYIKALSEKRKYIGANYLDNGYGKDLPSTELDKYIEQLKIALQQTENFKKSQLKFQTMELLYCYEELKSAYELEKLYLKKDTPKEKLISLANDLENTIKKREEAFRKLQELFSKKNNASGNYKAQYELLNKKLKPLILQ